MGESPAVRERSRIRPEYARLPVSRGCGPRTERRGDVAAQARHRSRRSPGDVRKEERLSLHLPVRDRGTSVDRPGAVLRGERSRRQVSARTLGRPDFVFAILGRYGVGEGGGRDNILIWWPLDARNVTHVLRAALVKDWAFRVNACAISATRTRPLMLESGEGRGTRGTCRAPPEGANLCSPADVCAP